MHNHRDAPLHVGERVALRDFISGQSGILVDCLSHDYFLVRWPDYPVPMTHHRYSLKRVTAEGAGEPRANCRIV